MSLAAEPLTGTVAVCRIPDCGKKNFARALCVNHWRRWRKHGDPLVIGKSGRPLRGDLPSFSAIHKRLERKRGKASQFVCVDCSAPAREWSYDNADPNEVTGPVGRFVVAYSLSLTHYEPRCTSCHRLFDNARRAS